MKPLRLLPSIFLVCKIAIANVLLMILAPGVHAALDPAVENLNQLVSQNRFMEAYELSVQMLEEFEGDPEFDFLYGLAALESGRPSEAVFAFERLTFSYPNQQRVKLELARAHFQSNNLSAARQLFNEVLAGEPTENVRANIEAFLARIDERERSITGSFTWFINTNVGTDSNINSATELGIINTPIGDVELSPAGRSIDDNFMDFGTGFNYVKPINKTSAFNLVGNYSLRNNLDTDDFDIGVTSLEGSYAHLVRDLRLSYGARAQMIQLDGDEFQRSGSLITTLQRNAGNGWSQAFTGAYTAVRFDDGLNANASLRDVNQLLLSGILGKSSGNFNHGLSVYYGTESVTKSAAKDNAQEFYGIAFSEQYQFRPTHIPYMRVSFHYSENKAPHVFFSKVREDNLFSTSLGWIWRALPNMNVTTDLTYMENDSNLDLFSYDRVRIQTGLRYQF